MKKKTKFVCVILIIVFLYIIACVTVKYYYTKNFIKNISTILEVEKNVEIKKITIGKITFNIINISNVYITKNQKKILYIKDIHIELSKYSFLIFIPKIKKITVYNADIDFNVLSNIDIQDIKGFKIPKHIFLSKALIYKIPSIKHIQIDNGVVKFGSTITLEADLASNKDSSYKLNYSFNTSNKQISASLYNKNNKITYNSDSKSIKINGQGTRIDFLTSSLLNNILPLEEDNEPFKIEIHGEKDQQNGSVIFKTINVDSRVLKVFGNASIFEKEFSINMAIPVILINKDELYKTVSFFAKITEIYQLIPAISNKNGLINIQIDSINNVIHNTNLNAEFKDSKLAKQVIVSSFGQDGKINIVGQNTKIKNANFLLAKITIQGTDINQVCNLASLQCKTAELSSFYITLHIMLSDYMTIIPFLRGKIGNANITANFNIKNQDSYDRIRGNIKLDNINIQNTNFFLQIGSDIRYKIGYTNSNIKVQIGNLKIKTNNFQNVSYTISTYDGKLYLRQIDIDSDEIKLKGFIEIKLNTIRPISRVKLQIDRINLPKLGASKYILNLYEYTSSDNSIRWKHDHFKLLNDNVLDFDMDLDVTLRNIVLNNDNIFDKGSIHIVLKELNMSIEKFELNTIEKGLLQLAGNIYIDNKPTLNLAFNLQNIKTENIVKNIFHLNFIKGGVSNCAGSILSSGNSIEELIYSMSGQFKILSAGFVMHGIDYENLIMNIPYINKKNELENLLQIDIFRNKTTVTSHSLEGEIKNGIIKSTGNFTTEYSADRTAINLMLQTLELSGVDIISFQLPQEVMTIPSTSIMMMLKGKLWETKIYFENDKIYESIRKVQNQDALEEMLKNQEVA